LNKVASILAIIITAVGYHVHANAEEHHPVPFPFDRNYDYADMFYDSGLSQEQLDILREQDPVEAQLIGRGFDTTLGQTKRVKCVERDPSKVLQPLSSTPDVKFHLTKILDEVQYTTASELSASAAYNWGGGGADARAQYLSEGKLSNYYSYAMEEVDVVYPEQSLDYNDFHLNKFARDLLKAGGIALFRFACGDSFILGYHRGGKFSAMMSVSAITTKEQSNDKQSISAYEGSGKIDGEAKHYFERKQSENRLHIEVVRSALEEKLPNFKLEELFEYTLAYPEKISKVRIKPIRSVLTDTYTAMLLKDAHTAMGPTPEWAKILADYFVYLRTLERYKADLIYIRDNNQQFTKFDPLPLASRIDAVNTAIDTVVAWASECFRTTGKTCKGVEPAKIRLPVLSPARAEPWVEGANINPKVAAPQPIGETPATMDMVFEAKGYWRFGRQPNEFGPITFSTEVQIINKSNPSDVRRIPTQQSLMIPRNFNVNFHYIDFYYPDNEIIPGEDMTAKVRLGGRVDPFIAGVDVGLAETADENSEKK